jgi:DNA-binding transcriptional LysR family regulator
MRDLGVDPRAPHEVMARCPCRPKAASGEGMQGISMAGRVIVNAPDLAVRAAVDGLGIAYALEALAEPFLRSGQLVQVLGNWSPAFEGLFLYYPGHRQVPAALRALIDMIRAVGGSTWARRSRENPFAPGRALAVGESGANSLKGGRAARGVIKETGG